MSGAPRFSEKWLQAYNERLRALSSARPSATRTPADRPDARQNGRKAPPRARTGLAVSSSAYAAEAVAVPSRAYGGKQTQTERRYNRDVLHGRGRFEAVSLYLPGGGRYTPDFMTVDDGVVTFHEVKGSYRLGSQGRALTAFQEAAAAFPMWRFVWAAERRGGGFDVRRVECAAMEGDGE